MFNRHSGLRRTPAETLGRIRQARRPQTRSGRDRGWVDGADRAACSPHCCLNRARIGVVLVPNVGKHTHKRTPEDSISVNGDILIVYAFGFFLADNRHTADR